MRFYVLDASGERLLAETRLANDGANPGGTDLEIVDLGGGRWQITLTGQEQADEAWLLRLVDGSPTMERQGAGVAPSWRPRNLLRRSTSSASRAPSRRGVPGSRGP